MVVVFPVPFTPTTKMTRGRGPCAARRRPIRRRHGAQGIEELIFQFRFEFRGAAQGLPLEFLPHGFENLMSGPGAEIGGEQSVLKFREQPGIDFLFAGDQVFDLGGDLRASLRDRLLQPVEQRPALFGLLAFFVFAED